ncbi:MAG TPA: response regulator [Candidatus Limnocylindrales bacterium]|nr:response regulator [Candidatus Limnocylindrales bacterium]
MPKTLLLADDSVTIQKVVGISFANEDVRLVTVDNGDDAVARARELRPDIVLADVVMPGMNGYEVCEAIKSDPALRHVPVLLLTGTFEAFDEARAARAGADGHITKPFEAQALVDTVNARLAAGPVPAAEPTPEPPAPADGAPSTGALGQDPLAAGAYDFFGEEEEVTEPGARGREASSTVTTVLLGDARPASEAGEDVFAFDAPQEPRRDVTPTPRPWEAPAQASAPPEEPLSAAHELFRPESTLGEAGDVLGEDTGFAEADTGPPELPLEPDLPATHPTTSFAEELPTPSAPGPQDDLDELFAPDARDVAEELELETAADMDVGDAEPLAEVGPDELAEETMLDPIGGRDYDVSSSDLGDPLAEEPGAAFPAPAPAPRIELPAPARPAPVPAPPDRAAWSEPTGADAAAPDLSPLMRERLHESLEKIAWEAFSDVSERIVKEALERIEAVAWEVIPQMAEALIREEIRHLKDEEA